MNGSPEKVTILVMGAQTDVALALQEDPGIIDNISHIVVMGGAFTLPGNLNEGPEKTSNQVAEWNMYIDSLAAKTVFNSGVSLSIVPLDGIQYLVQSEDIAAIKASDDPGVQFVAQNWMDQWSWSGPQGGFLIWDTITATAVTDPENFKWVYDGVDVITDPGDFQGQTVPLKNGARHIRYAVGADYPAIMDQLFETFRRDGPPAPAVTAGPEPVITELAGTWQGFTGNFHIIFTLGPACKLNQKCGTFEIPEFSLSGDVTFVKLDGDLYEFKATNISSGQPGNDYEYLQVLGDGRLKYHTQGSGVTSEAILEKQ